MQVPAGTVQDHTLICKDLDRAINATDSLNERLQRLADCCEACSMEEQSLTHRTLLLRLADHCTSASVVPANSPSSSSRACQVMEAQCLLLKLVNWGLIPCLECSSVFVLPCAMQYPVGAIFRWACSSDMV